MITSESQMITRPVPLLYSQMYGIDAVTDDDHLDQWIVDAAMWWCRYGAAESALSPHFDSSESQTVLALAADKRHPARLNVWLALAADNGWVVEVAAGAVLGETTGRIAQRVQHGQRVLDDLDRAPGVLASLPPVPMPADMDMRDPDLVAELPVQWPVTAWNEFVTTCEGLGWSLTRGCRQFIADQLVREGFDVLIAGNHPSMPAWQDFTRRADSWDATTA